MLEGSRTIWRVSLYTSARMRRSFDGQALEGLEGAVELIIVEGAAPSCRSCGRRRASPASLFDHGDERVIHAGRGPAFCPCQLAYLRRRTLRQNLTGIHDRDAVAVLRLLHEMRGHDDCHPLFCQRGDAAPECAA